MNLHKYYLQTEAEKLEAAEKKIDFIPDLTNHAAARALDSLCDKRVKSAGSAAAAKTAEYPKNS